jgi:hypothetical protein
MTTTRRITTTTAILLSLAAAGAQAASARPADFPPASHHSPASVYSRPDKTLIPLVAPVAGSSSTSMAPILPRITAPQLAAIEQSERQAAAYTPPKGSSHSDAETNAYARLATDHITSAVVAATPPNTFDWGDAGIGAAAGFILAMLGLGAALVIGERRLRLRRETTGLTS